MDYVPRRYGETIRFTLYQPWPSRRRSCSNAQACITLPRRNQAWLWRCTLRLTPLLGWALHGLELAEEQPLLPRLTPR